MKFKWGIFVDEIKGVVYYFSMWYKRRERQYRISLFFSAASLAGAFGGILAYVWLSTSNARNS